MMNKNDSRSPGHFTAEWGWLKCREAVMKEAVRRFVSGDDNVATMLRDFAGSRLVLERDTLKGAPLEHCKPGCDCR